MTRLSWGEIIINLLKGYENLSPCFGLYNHIF